MGSVPVSAAGLGDSLPVGLQRSEVFREGQRQGRNK